MSQRDLARKVTKLFGVWRNMRNRCNPSYKDKHPRYGGRGIKVCDRWEAFENFVEDMLPTYQEGLSLDRRNNDRHYTPANCHWVTPLAQVSNRHNTIRVDTPRGPLLLRDLAQETGVAYTTLRRRYSKGDRWPEIGRRVTRGGNQGR